MKFSSKGGELKFFAAANSYNGFISYFGKVFNPERFDKIFILKGGPGTGKSSLMKRILRTGVAEGFYSEAIYCSSDVNSLDGVILSSEKRQIAVLDGTAPHATDPQIPGAVEEIINLGIGWDAKLLCEQRDRIVMLNKAKLKAYTKAYENLYISSVFHKKYEAEIESEFDFVAAERKVEEMISNLQLRGEGIILPRLISSFSKDGFTRLETLEKNSEQIIKLGGNGYSEYIFINLLVKRLNQIGANYFYFPTPYNTNSNEALYIPDCKLAVIVSDNANCDINTENLCCTKSQNSEDLERYKRLKKSFIEYSCEELKCAARRHFELEDIYIEAMDFSVIEELAESVEKRCKNILSGAI